MPTGNISWKKIFTWPRVYDLLILAGNFVFGAALGDRLFEYTMGKSAELPAGIALFYICAVVLYLLGLLLYMMPLRHCSAVNGVPRPEFTQGDSAALMFNSCIFGLAGALAVVQLASPSGEMSVSMGFVLTAVFFISGGFYMFILYRAMGISGKGGGMDRKKYYLMMAAGFTLMYPMIIGIFGPIDAIQASLDIRLDSSPAAGVLDVLLRSGVRAVVLSLMAWAMVYIIRRIASVPFGVRGRGFIFFIELSATYMLMFVLRYYDIKYLKALYFLDYL